MPEFHLFLPQMRMTLDAIVERAQAAEAAGFTGMSGMDHLVPPLAPEHPMYEAMTTNMWLAARHESPEGRQPRALRRVPPPDDVGARGGDDRPRVRRSLRARDRIGLRAKTSSPRSAWAPSSRGDRTTRLGETLEVLRAALVGRELHYEGQFFTITEGRTAPHPAGTHPDRGRRHRARARWRSSPSTPTGGTARCTGSTSSTRCAPVPATRGSRRSRW